MQGEEKKEGREEVAGRREKGVKGREEEGEGREEAADININIHFHI